MDDGCPSSRPREAAAVMALGATEQHHPHTGQADEEIWVVALLKSAELGPILGDPKDFPEPIATSKGSDLAQVLLGGPEAGPNGSFTKRRCSRRLSP